MDCMEGMKRFPDKYFDLAIVDPPYGIDVGTASMGAGGGVAPHRNRSAANIKGGAVHIGGAKPFGNSGGGLCVTPKIYHSFDDTKIPDEDYFKELERVAKNRIIWGGNYFLKYLGETPCMLFWDKGRRGLNFADGELAWTSFKEPSRCFNFKWNGMLQENMKNKEYRIHPTQKPVALYEWLLDRYAKQGDIILDTHVGSASSLIACHNRGFKYVGFELDKHYYEESKKRLEAEIAQMSIFDFIERTVDNENSN